MYETDTQTLNAKLIGRSGGQYSVPIVTDRVKNPGIIDHKDSNLRDRMYGGDLTRYGGNLNRPVGLILFTRLSPAGLGGSDIFDENA